MATAARLRKFLEDRHIRSESLPHPHTATTQGSATAAHVDADCVAKAVMVGDEQGLMMAVIPASHHVKMKHLRRETGRRLHFIAERDFAAMFPDCEIGAIPPLGAVYGMEMIWDDCLAEQSEIYFEAGDHENLLHVSGREFVDMVRDSPHACISKPH